MPEPSSIHPVVSIQQQLVTDRQTHNDSIYRANIASRGENEVLRVSSGLSGCGCSVQCVMFTTCTATTSGSAAGGDLQADSTSGSDQCGGRRSLYTSRNAATKILLRSTQHS